jgi:hypothetical protein
MATYVKYQDAVEKLGTAIHNFDAAGHVFKAAIHTDAPTVATDDELADLTQITGTGYTAGGEDIQNSYSETTGTGTAVGVDVVWTAGAADWTSTARYVSVHNDTSTTDKLWNYWDYGATFAVGNGETFTLDFGATWFTIA